MRIGSSSTRELTTGTSGWSHMEAVALRRQSYTYREAQWLSLLLMTPFLAAADVSVANLAGPAIRRGLGASGTAVQLVVGAYIVAYAVLLITGARLGRAYGYKRLFVLGMTMFGTASLVGGLAPNLVVLVVMRVLQGTGAALMVPQALTGIQLGFTGARRVRAIAGFAASLSLGAVFGQVVGGALVSADILGSSWRPIFLINVPICYGTAMAAHRLLPPDPVRGASCLDLPGVLTLCLSVLLLVVPLTVGPTTGWPSWTWVALAASVPCFGLFLATQRRAATMGRDPLIDAGLMSRPTIAWGLVAMSVAYATNFALLFVVAKYVQLGLGHSALVSGFVLVPWSVAFGVSRPILGLFPAWVAPWLPTGGFLVLSLAYLAVGVALLAGQLPAALLAGVLTPGGFGLGATYTTMVSHLTDAVSTRHASDLSGLIPTTSQIGGAIGIAGFGSLYLTLAGAHAAAQAFAVIALVLGATALVGALAAYLAIRHASRRG